MGKRSGAGEFHPRARKDSGMASDSAHTEIKEVKPNHGSCSSRHPKRTSALEGQSQ